MERAIRIHNRVVSASLHSIEEMRERLRAAPMLERADIAYRASSMVRQAAADHQLAIPLRGDGEDAVAMLLVLGVTVVHQ